MAELLAERVQPPVSRRLLFLLPFAPRLDATHGGSRSLAEMITAMASRHQVALLCLRGADEPPIDEILKSRCDVIEEVVRPAISYSWRRRIWLVIALLRGQPQWVSDWATVDYHRCVRSLVETWQPDIVQIEFPVMGQYLAALDTCPAPRVLADRDPGPQAARDQFKSQRGLRRLIHYLDMRAWQRFERSVIKQVQTVVALTERDQQALAPFAEHTPLIQIPFGTALSMKPLDPLGGHPLSLLFVGSFIHPPNEDAAMRLINAIFPRIATQCPDVILKIVGDRPPARLQQLADERVMVTGRVADVTPYLDQATLVVVPLRMGGGMRVKVLEALAAGKAIVASPLAIAGLDLVDGTQIVLAETDEQFAAAIVQLLGDPARRAALAANARAWACAHLGWEKVIGAYEDLYQRLLSDSAEALHYQETV